MTEDPHVIDRENFRNLLVEIAGASMPFGKYGKNFHPPDGMPLMDLPEEYLGWFSQKGFPKGRLGELMAEVHAIQLAGMDRVFDPFRPTGRTPLRRPRRPPPRSF